MVKRGQIQLSFSMIFSIIIIIATVAVAVYIIIYFKSLNNDVVCKSFQKDLSDRITYDWNSDIANEPYSAVAPGGVKLICFGNITRGSVDTSYNGQLSEIRKYGRASNNMFFSPANTGCKNSKFGYKLDHVQDSAFFCVPVLDGKLKIIISKGRYDAFVSLSK
jgi:hypothetical protein